MDVNNITNKQSKKVDEELANDSASSVMSVESGLNGKLWRKRLRPRNDAEKKSASSDEELPTATKVGKAKKGKRRAVTTDQQITQVTSKTNEIMEEKVTKLLAENARLQEELLELRKEFAELKANNCKCSTRKQSANSSVSRSYAEVTTEMSLMDKRMDISSMSREELVRHISSLVLETLLAQSQQNVSLAGIASSFPKEATASTSTGKKGQKAQMVLSEHNAAPKPAQVTLPQNKKSSSKAHQEEWVVVEKNKKKGRKQTNKSDRVPRLRAPSSAAVVITLQPEAVEKGLTYDKVLNEAATKIQLADLGIEELKYKKTMTGGGMFRLSGAGPDSEAKANALASKLKETLNMSGVQISRPVKCVDIRISGLDETVTTAKLLDALARAAECPLNQLKCNGVWPSFNGTLTGVVNCPIQVAQKLGDGRRILVGWVSAQVKILRAKPLRCYRCLNCGHVAAKCKAKVDCSTLCFRCGKAGHKAGNCEATPHCLVCAAVSRPAEHRVGSGTCAAPNNPAKKKRSKKGDKNSPQSARSSAASKAPAGESKEMECH